MTSVRATMMATMRRICGEFVQILCKGHRAQRRPTGTRFLKSRVLRGTKWLAVCQGRCRYQSECKRAGRPVVAAVMAAAGENSGNSGTGIFIL